MCLVVLTLDYFVTVIVTPEDLLVERLMKILLFFGNFCVTGTDKVFEFIQSKIVLIAKSSWQSFIQQLYVCVLG